MSPRRILWIMVAGLVCGAIAVGSSLGTAHAQGLKAPDDPFGDINLESLKKKPPAPVEAVPTPQEPAPEPDVQVQREVQQ